MVVGVGAGTALLMLLRVGVVVAGTGRVVHDEPWLTLA